MKILMVTPMLPAPNAGTAQPQVMYAQLSALATKHEVNLLTFAGPDEADRIALTDLCRSGLDIEAVWRDPVSGMRQVERRLRLAGGWLWGARPLKPLWFSNPKMQRALNALLAQKAFDLVQVEDIVMAGYKFRSSARRVLTDHDVRTSLPGEFDAKLLPLGENNLLSKGQIGKMISSAEARRWRRFQPQAWKDFDRIQVFTNRDASVIHSMAPQLSSRVRLNPFGIDLPAEADHTHERNDTVMFMGMFLHPANVDAALWIAHDIMPLLRRQRPGVRLWIVGGHAPESVRSLEAEDITVTGYVSEIRPLVEQAGVVLVPVRIGGGMRMKVLQAMALGKAVVTTALGAEGLAFGEALPPLRISESAEGIASAAAQLLKAQDIRRELGCRARAFVREYHGWPAYMRRLEATYAELLRAPSTEN